MIERHVTFDVLPSKEAEFESFVDSRYRPAMSKMPGFVKLDLLCEIDVPNCFKMIIRFGHGSSQIDTFTG